jgi:hypothetical protein
MDYRCLAGSVDASEFGRPSMVTDFFVPVLIGNIIGGTVLFALIAYAQVMEEMKRYRRGIAPRAAANWSFTNLAPGLAFTLQSGITLYRKVDQRCAISTRR